MDSIHSRVTPCPAPFLAAIRLLAAYLTVVLLSLFPAHAQTGGFTDLGNGGYTTAIARGVSDGGFAVVINAGDSGIGLGSSQPFLWTPGGLTPLADLGYGSIARAISADGSVIAGTAAVDALHTRHAVLWDATGAITDLGAAIPGGQSSAFAISADGGTAVGRADFVVTGGIAGQAFTWTAGSGFSSLGSLVTGGGGRSSALAVSGDGAAIAGWADTDVMGTSGGAVQHAFRWTQTSPGTGTMSDLGALGGLSANSAALGLSRDGNVAVGLSELAGGSTVHAFRWSAGNMADLGTLPGGTASIAWATNADGSVVAGTSINGGTGTAFRWTETTGMQDLKSLLTQAGVNMTGVTLGSAYAISADGQLIAGGPYAAPHLGGIAAPIPADTAGNAWLVRYCGGCVLGPLGPGPLAGATTLASAQASIAQVAQARTTLLVQQNAAADPLLGSGQRILPQPGQHGTMGAFVAAGSAESGAFARYDTLSGLSIMGGISYVRTSFQGVQVQPSMMGAMALRYVQGGFNWFKPLIEAGGWLVPGAQLSFARSYINGAGTATARLDTTGNFAYYYARAGAVLETVSGGEIALTGEIGRAELRTGGFAEAATSGNPFNAEGGGADSTVLVGKIRVQLNHPLTRNTSLGVWGAAAAELDSASNFAATVAELGSFQPKHLQREPWAEYGARLSHSLAGNASLDITASGVAGPAVGSGLHVGATLRYNF